ncbi:DUF3164 family protein [Parasphaerochaeta coccoides]|uniref:Sulfate transport protein CysZ n=1 Tax=Parasphaerochaeta coccoides (strain ATCC BAA-1237 / DSM 17374 / SPN1) TaxID=760011 RepID=F4GHU8_PARC1|nr:DUF3164 family protein [Parasphaerochaeta coccoides]AEC02061.1 putative sulfate transport protein CysZ [Parasphaerochaeta coccoides DSM 17374]
MKTQVSDGKTYAVNAKNELVPIEAIKEIDQLRDQVIEKIEDRLIELQQKMENAKAEAMADINEFVRIAGEQHGVNIGGAKGNLSLTSFDGSTQILLAMSDSLDFTEGIHVAKQLIDEYLTDITKDAAADLRILVSKAFRVKQGKLDVKRILELRSYNIEDPRWKKAMDIISDSTKVISSKQCFRLRKRKDSDSSYALVNLDFSTI